MGFETLARDIVFRDILNRGEAPFWHQPLYRWVVAGIHVFFGDSVVWVFIAHMMIFACTLLLVYRLGARVFSRGAEVWVIFVMLVGFRGARYFYWIGSGYACIVGQFLLVAGLCVLAGWIQNPGKSLRAFYAGLVLGLSILTRTNLVFIVPFLMVWGIVFWIKRWIAGIIGWVWHPELRVKSASLLLVYVMGAILLSVVFFGLNTANYRLVIPLYTILSIFAAAMLDRVFMNIL